MKTTLHHHAIPLAVALALAITTAPPSLAGQQTPPATTQADSGMTEADVRALLASNGYTEINDVEFKEGTWTADGKSADGNHVELRIDAATRKIYPDDAVANVGKERVIANVMAAGFRNVHDVELEDGVWKAEANDADGNDVEVTVDPKDGHIIGSKKDVVGGNK
ncbi:PepSY domain-containing protein [Arenimonas sp.]|uniref:PepSY domain-containing protein n=1 Tax=Arenimonas sp. TaxID=1872635 RepID=UPI0039E6B842